MASAVVYASIRRRRVWINSIVRNAMSGIGRVANDSHIAEITYL